MYTHVCAHVCRGQWLTLNVLLHCAHLIFETGPLTNLELAEPASPRDPIVLSWC